MSGIEIDAKLIPRTCYESFGLSQRPSELLHSFMHGAVELEKNEVEAISHMRLIPIYLALDGNGSKLSAGYVSHSRLIYVSRNYLNIASFYDRDSVIFLNRRNGEEVFAGMIDDFIFLAGVEEAHHGYFFENVKPKFHDPQIFALAIYDSQDHEFASLMYRLEVALQRNMLQVTIEILEKRIMAARLVRSNGYLPEEVRKSSM